MTELNLNISSPQRSSGDNTNYSFNPFLLPSNFNIGDTVQLDLVDYYFNWDSTSETRGVDIRIETMVNGLKLEQITMGLNSNSPWMHVNTHKNISDWPNRTIFEQFKYKCVLTDQYLQFNVRTVDLSRIQLIDNNMSETFMNFKLTKM